MYSPSYTLRCTLMLNVTEYKHTPNYKAVKGGIDSCPVVLVLLLPSNSATKSSFFLLLVFGHFRHHYDKNHHHHHHHHNHNFHQHNQLKLDSVILA